MEVLWEENWYYYEAHNIGQCLVLLILAAQHHTLSLGHFVLF